jgi:tetratricopeptide (TPR) repeat protein
LRQKTDLKKGLEFYENIFLSFPEDKERILKDLERICQLNYGNPYPKFLRGKLLFYENKFEKGIQHLEMASELNKKYIEESIKIMESIIAKDKIPLLLLYLAKYQIKQGRIEKAITYAKEMETLKEIPFRDVIKIYTEIIRKDSKNLDVHFSLARLYAKEGKYDPVLSELTAIIEMNPEKSEEAASIAEEIIKQDPYNSNLLYFLSDLYLESRKPNKAILALEKLFKANKEVSGEIIEKLNLALEKDLENVNGLNLLAAVYCYKKKFNEALLIYDHLMDLEGGFDLAEEGIRKITEENPDLLKARISLGLVAFKKGKHKESLEIISSVVEKDSSKVSQLIPQLDYIARKSVELAPYVLQVYDTIPSETIEPFILDLAKAEAFSLSEDYKNAVIYYNKCFETKPGKVEKIINGLQRILEKKEGLSFVHLALGNIYLKIDKINNGLEHYKVANELDSKLSDEIIHILYKLVKKFPDEPSITNELLRSLIHKGAYEQVIVECEDAINKFPKEKTGPIYLMHGRASLEKGLLKQAALSIVHALDIDETLSSEAMKLLKTAIEIDKSNAVVKYGLAKAYMAAKEYSNAAFRFYDITKADPTKTVKAIEELNIIVEIDRVNPDAHFVLGSLFLTEKRLKDAIEEFRTASELNDSFIDKVIGKLHYIEKHSPIPEVHLNLGELYMKKKMFSKATHHLMEALRQDENLVEQAASYLNKIKDKDPQNFVVLYALAEIAEKEGDLKNTIDIYERILNMVPEELPNIRHKVENMIKEHEGDIELLIFLSKSLYLDGEIEESIRILKGIVNEHPEEISVIMEKLREMSNRGEDGATFCLIEYLLENNSYEEAITLTRKIELNFSFHNRIISCFKNQIKEDPTPPGLALYLSRFLYLRDDWETLSEVISRGLAIVKEESAEPLLLLKYLLLAKKGKDVTKLKNELIENMGKKHFYSSIKEMEREKKEFQLKRVCFTREKSPDVSALIFEQAELLNELGHTDEAINLLGNPFKHKKDRVMANYLIAKSFSLKKNPIRSIVILRGIPLPHNKEFKNKLLLLLSSSYEKIGDYETALITLKNCEPDIEIEKRINYLNEMSIIADVKGRFPLISG